MKKWIYNIAWVMMAFVSLTLTSCDDDVDIARTLEGTWEGDMYTSTYWNGRYYDASYSQICFLRDPYTYSSGTGYWVDYYDDNYWGSYNYVTSHIEFTVKNRVINIYFVEDHESVSIYDYSLSDNYFTGYIELYNGDRRQFRLRHVSSPNWSNGPRPRFGFVPAQTMRPNSANARNAPRADQSRRRATANTPMRRSHAPNASNPMPMRRDTPATSRKC